MRSKNSCYWSVQSTTDEKETVDRAAKKAGLNRNAFIRRWIASLAAKQREEGVS